MAWSFEDQYEEDRYEALRDRAEEAADNDFAYGLNPNDFATDEEYEEAMEQAEAEEAMEQERRYFHSAR